MAERHWTFRATKTEDLVIAYQNTKNGPVPEGGEIFRDRILSTIIDEIRSRGASVPGLTTPVEDKT